MASILNMGSRGIWGMPPRPIVRPCAVSVPVRSTDDHSACSRRGFNRPLNVDILTGKRRSRMSIEVFMPRLSDTMEEGKVLKWLKKVGDQVEVGDIIAEV